MDNHPLLSPVKALARTLVNLEIAGKENIPNQGGVLLTTNHLSRLDTPLLMTLTERTDLVAIVAKEYKEKPFFRWILSQIGTMVWMDRSRMDFAATREALDHLRKGAIVGIAPEGTRSSGSKALMEGKQGAALMAASAAVPIVPVGIAGSEQINARWARLQRPLVSIRVGKTYTLPRMDRDDRQAWLENATDEIMCRIAVQLPENYRGFYANHPRLLELLKEQGM